MPRPSGEEGPVQDAVAGPQARRGAARWRAGAGRRQAFLGTEVDGKVGSLGLAQIASGYAWAATGYDYPFKKRYLKVAAAAKKSGAGYHGTC